MSNIDMNTNTVVPYISGKTKALQGQRLAVVTYKTDKETGIKKDSKAVSVPQISDDAIIDNLPSLVGHIRSMLAKTQDAIIRERLDSGVNVAHITNEEISIAACIEYLENSNESGRLTKESVGAWFDSTIADNLTVVLADKLGVSDTPTFEEQSKIDLIVAGFKDRISSLAGGKTVFPVKEAESIKKALNLAPNDDALATRFVARIDKMLSTQKQVVSLADVL